MKKIADHCILVQAESYSSACHQVRYYFKKTSLVLYDYLKISKERSMSAASEGFEQELNGRLKDNRQSILKLIKELETGGLTKTSELENLRQGHLSKTLHLLTHFLDGFISVDSAFYSLVDDCHNITYQTQERMKKTPEHYWIVSISGYAESLETGSLLSLQGRNWSDPSC
ncbi:hypothetical protein [Desulfotalea psychrophila]|uniref:Uncharacterized protein n=1 Tax=Desulfotalea psychrophila (strain LSv54 / DSM 12343) TaxID=177439 RepID=Q6AIZ0_DESPS|nr:hypothetical protein [Desulfotalea psychrophila]CAG37690.1 unknown protein [Desulfotalea psychrophila LSv54]